MFRTRWCVVVGMALAGLACSQAVGRAQRAWGEGYVQPEPGPLPPDGERPPAQPRRTPGGSVALFLFGPDATPEDPVALPLLSVPASWARADGRAPSPAPAPEVSPPGATPFQLTQKHEGELGQFTGKVTLQPGPGGEPSQTTRAWQTDQAWRLPLSGPFFAFGQMAAASDEAAQKDMKLAGRTGLACKLPVGPAEFVVRGGPGVSYTDPLRPPHTREQADWQLGVEARCPLVFGAGLEYEGTATPARTPLERDRVRQDVHLAIPVGEAGKLQVGARHLWESAAQPRPWSEGMEVYFGLRLQR